MILRLLAYRLCSAIVVLLLISPRLAASSSFTPDEQAVLSLLGLTPPAPSAPPPGCANSTDASACAGLFALLQQATRNPVWASSAPQGCADGWTDFVASGGVGGTGVCAFSGVLCDPFGRVSTFGVAPGCGLSATIPAAMSGLTSLTALVISGNSLVGTIPAGLFDEMSSLRTLDLSNNFLSGSLPSMASLTSLTSLVLRQNSLSGQLGALADLQSLTHLDLAGNSFSGPLIDALPYSSLTLLDVSFNALQGRFPAALANLRNNARLAAHSSGLCLALPPGTQVVPIDANTGRAFWEPGWAGCGLISIAKTGEQDAYAVASTISQVLPYLFPFEIALRYINVALVAAAGLR